MIEVTDSGRMLKMTVEACDGEALWFSTPLPAAVDDHVGMERVTALAFGLGVACQQREGSAQ